MPNMFTAPVDTMLRARCGQTFFLPANTPTYVSPQAQIDAVAAGCVPIAPWTPALAAAASVATSTTVTANSAGASAASASAAAADALIAEESALP